MILHNKVYILTKFKHPTRYKKNCFFGGSDPRIKRFYKHLSNKNKGNLQIIGSWNFNFHQKIYLIINTYYYFVCFKYIYSYHRITYLGFKKLLLFAFSVCNLLKLCYLYGHKKVVFICIYFSSIKAVRKPWKWLIFTLKCWKKRLKRVTFFYLQN